MHHAGPYPSGINIVAHHVEHRRLSVTKSCLTQRLFTKTGMVELSTAGRMTDSIKMPSVSKRPRRFFVQIERNPEVQAARLELPVCMHEQEIIEAIHANDVVLIEGCTGTGKTTQVPQFLVEDGFGDPRSRSTKGMIGVTQPRRIAAVSCAKRVAFEMGSEVGKTVGYQIRHEARFGSDTKVKFATDGILLREAEEDIPLKNYSAIIVDEVHERSMNTDLLLSFLSRSIALRKLKRTSLAPLKVIIMSATLNIHGAFSGEEALFPNPAIINVPSRRYPIAIHFAHHTRRKYVDEAFKKVCRIHSRLPQGGVLIFLSGRQEIEALCSKIRDEFGGRKVRVKGSEGLELGVTVFPFYALLPDQHQRKVFEDVAQDMRKIVVATNVAETSVTIPGIAYVVDSGRVKEKVFKGPGGGLLSSFEVRWISQAAAKQRAGRAGRTGPGHCYRLYSSAVFDQHFEKYRQPEILRVPADAVVLRLRAMGILHVSKFPFPTRPKASNVSYAEKVLTDLGALYRKNALPSLKLEHGISTRARDASDVLLGVSKIGRDLAKLPLPPRLGKILLTAESLGSILPYACRIASVLAVGTVLDKARPDFARRQQPLRNRKSDVLTELAAVCAVEYASRGESVGASRKREKVNMAAMRFLCEELSIHLKSVMEVICITEQLEKMFVGTKEEGKFLKPPTREQEEKLFRALVSAFPDRVARRMTRQEAASRGVIPKRQKVAFTVAGRDDAVFLEGSSSVDLDRDVEFVCFANLVEICMPKRKEKTEEEDDYDESEDENEMAEEAAEEAGEGGENMKKKKTGGDDEDEKEGANAQEIAAGYESESKVVMQGTTVMQADWIAEEATNMCSFRRDTKMGPKTGYNAKLESVTEDIIVSYGKRRWELGTKAMPVRLLPHVLQRATATSAADSEDRGYCRTLATALSNGEVGKGLVLKLPDAHLHVFRRVLSDRLGDFNVCDMAALRALIADRPDVLDDVVAACAVGRAGRKAMDEWHRGLKLLLSEHDGGVGGTHHEVNGFSRVDEDDEEGWE